MNNIELKNLINTFLKKNKLEKGLLNIEVKKAWFDLMNNGVANYTSDVSLEKDNAVNDFRVLIGSTNPEEAEEGSIRKMFAKSISENAIHGSDSDDNAKIECQFHFSKDEIF